VAAFTHAASENCLRKVAALDAQLRVYEGCYPIAKLDGSRTPGAPLESLTSREAESWLNERQQAVVGGTVWAIRKALEPASVDVLVVDEASQLRVPESTIALRRLGGSGRALIAGDDRQLPPIVQAVYPESEPGEPLLHRSLFEALSRPAEAHASRSVLLENFRMNETLCRFPREQVYVPGYRSASGEVAGRELIIERGDDPLVDAIVAPEFPLVIGILDGVRAGAENRIEAELVASVATALREGLCGADGKVYGEDAAFWREGLFVVSPHHAQINAIRRALRRKRQWSVPPFVDTVDAMQGQECDAVVTSYGVADVEYAMGEREFIYSLNRLNVAITRARCKSIVFLSRPLIEPPVPAYEDDRIAEGIAFMQGLVEFAEANGTTLEFPLPDGGTLTLHRVPMLPPAEVQS
jgi:superfamily I DNA and/or RNA helicase